MHIAICDDNIADRKQMERLLSRESDKRKTDTGVFYTRSFGNSAALSRSPMQYNLIFIDIVGEKPDGYTFALELIQAGVTAPIVLCLSAIDYRRHHQATEHPPANISFLEKPVKVAALSALIDHALTLQADIPPTIELRTDWETCYLKEQDIVCGYGNGGFVEVVLANGRTLIVTDTLLNLYGQLLPYASFMIISKKAFINVDYIDKYTFFKVTLQNGKTLSVAPEFHREMKRRMAE